MPPQWKADTFRIAPDRKFNSLRAPGTMLDSPLLGTPTQRLTGFVHWWAPVEALGWLREARARMDNAKRVMATWGMRPMNGYDAGWLNYRGAVDALNNALNAFNIPWYMHRGSRELYWEVMSGPPDPATLFDPNRNWNGKVRGWYTNGFKEPLLDRSSVGTIPTMIRTLYATRDNSGVANQFVQTLNVNAFDSIGITGWGSMSQQQQNELLLKKVTNDWFYQNNIVNSLSLVSGMGWWGDAWIVENARTPLTDSNRLHDVGVWDDPRSFRADFGIHISDDPMKASLGSAHYANWIDRWIDLLLATEPNEIVISAREMACWFNENWIKAYGGSSSAIIGAAAREFGEASATNPALQVSVAVVSMAGAALATVTYGISAIVAGAYALGVSIYGATAPPNQNKVSAQKDDLGRFKPCLERAWLSGNPSDTTLEGAPTTDVPDVFSEPGAFGAPVSPFKLTPGQQAVADRIAVEQRAFAASSLQRLAGLVEPAPYLTQGHRAPSTNKSYVIAGVIFVTGLLAAAYYWFFMRKPAQLPAPRSTPLSARSNPRRVRSAPRLPASKRKRAKRS